MRSVTYKHIKAVVKVHSITTTLRDSCHALRYMYQSRIFDPIVRLSVNDTNTSSCSTTAVPEDPFASGRETLLERILESALSTTTRDVTRLLKPYTQCYYQTVVGVDSDFV